MKTATGDPYDGLMSDSGPESTIQDYVSTLLRGKMTILISFGVAVFAMAVYTFVSKPVYESSSLVLVNLKQQAGGVSIGETTREVADSKITNELAILKSRLLAEAVAKVLLESPFLDDAKQAAMPIVKTGGSAGDQNALAAQSTVATRLSRAMDFVPERESDVIRILAKSSDPRESAVLANTYADVFQEHELSITKTRSKSLREFLQNQLAAKKQGLESAESELKRYMEASGVVSLDAQASRVTQQLSQLEANRDAVDIDIESLSKTLTTYQERLPEQEREAAKVMKQANDPYIKRIQEQLANLQVQRDVLMNQDLTAVGKEVYAQKLKEIEGQINNLQKKLDERASTFLQGGASGEVGSMQADPAGYLTQARQKIFETQMEIQALQSKKSALNNVIRQYESEFGQIPQKSIELAKLQRNRMSAEKLYMVVDEKFNQISIVEKSEFANVGVIDKASVPFLPVSPVLSINLLLGALFGFTIGVGIVLVREYLDIRINTPDGLKQRGYAVLSFVGRLEGRTPEVPLPLTLSQGGKGDHRFLVALTEPFSPAAEGYRRLRSKLEYALPESQTRRIVVTSPNAGEGKTTSIINLAIAFAQAERRVLLVDGDLRRPKVHTVLGFDVSPGLGELLAGNATMQQVIHTNVIRHLDVICAGELSTQAPEILGSKHMARFLKEVDRVYDWVLIDTSPILAVSDAATLAVMVDGAVLVVSGGETRLVALERAVEQVVGTGGKVLGVFLSKFDAQKAYGGFYGGDKYGFHTTAYGKKEETNGEDPSKKKLIVHAARGAYRTIKQQLSLKRQPKEQ